MITYNVDLSDGIVNGSLGTVRGFVQQGPKFSVQAVLIEFDDPETGKNTRQSFDNEWRRRMETSTSRGSLKHPNGAGTMWRTSHSGTTRGGGQVQMSLMPVLGSHRMLFLDLFR